MIERLRAYIRAAVAASAVPVPVPVPVPVLVPENRAGRAAMAEW